MSEDGAEPAEVQKQELAGETEGLNPLSLTVFNKAKSAAEAYNKLVGLNLELTANVIEFDLYLPELDYDDADRPTACQAISEMAKGSTSNIGNLLRHYQNNPKRPLFHLEQISDHISNTDRIFRASPDLQFVAIHQAMNRNIDYLTENYRSEIHIPLMEAQKNSEQYSSAIGRVLDRLARLGEASEELIDSGRLKTRVKTLVDIADIPQFRQGIRIKT